MADYKLHLASLMPSTEHGFTVTKTLSIVAHSDEDARAQAWAMRADGYAASDRAYLWTADDERFLGAFC